MFWQHFEGVACCLSACRIPMEYGNRCNSLYLVCDNLYYFLFKYFFCTIIPTTQIFRDWINSFGCYWEFNFYLKLFLFSDQVTYKCMSCTQPLKITVKVTLHWILIAYIIIPYLWLTCMYIQMQMTSFYFLPRQNLWLSQTHDILIMFKNNYCRLCNTCNSH